MSEEKNAPVRMPVTTFDSSYEHSLDRVLDVRRMVAAEGAMIATSAAAPAAERAPAANRALASAAGF